LTDINTLCIVAPPFLLERIMHWSRKIKLWLIKQRMKSRAITIDDLQDCAASNLNRALKLATKILRLKVDQYNDEQKAKALNEHTPI